MSKTLQTSPSALSDDALRDVIEELQGGVADQILTTGGLTIGSSAATAVKIATTVYAMVDGVLTSKTTAEIAIAGTVSNAAFNVFVLTIDSAGAVTASMGTEGTALADVVFPTVPDNEAVIGFVIVNPTGTGDFVGGTTDLDDGTVVPNAVYIDTVGAFNPNLVAL